MKGGRYISAKASALGEWKQGGASISGADAYATSKQCVLAATLAFAHESPRLRFNAIEPGITRQLASRAMRTSFFVSCSAKSLHCSLRSRDTGARRSARRGSLPRLTDQSGRTGSYYDEKGQPILGSKQVGDPNFQDRVVAETRALQSTVRPPSCPFHEAIRVGGVP